MSTSVLVFSILFMLFCIACPLFLESVKSFDKYMDELVRRYYVFKD